VGTNTWFSERQITALSCQLQDTFRKAITDLILAEDDEEKVASVEKE
jgi:hypothetical protein